MTLRRFKRTALKKSGIQNSTRKGLCSLLLLCMTVSHIPEFTAHAADEEGLQQGLTKSLPAEEENKGEMETAEQKVDDPGDDPKQVQFEILGIRVEGNTLLPERPLDDDPESPFSKFPTIQTTLEDFVGPDKTVADIEAAREALEKVYHELGYPTVIVNIPEQTIEDGMVRLEVVESVIRRVRITGNRFFTMDNILSHLPSMQEGEILYLPHLQEELMTANRNPDLRIEPVLMPGKHFGTVDIELKVVDKLPLHGSLELNNRSSANTTDLRLNGMLRYDNLWQKEHSISFQFQTSPQKTEEVQVLAGSYVLPTPWNDDHRLAFFSVWSDSATAFGEGFHTNGKGFIFGARYVMPLLPYGLYTHNLSIGLDYKKFDEELQFDTETIVTPITYMPLTIAYNGSHQTKSGVTSFNSSLNMSFRDVVSNESEFDTKGYLASSSYLYITGGIQRMQKMPWQSKLFCKLDGQLSDKSLISNEQYTAGGMESVRGYKESTSSGDNALHATIEYVAPELTELLNLPFKNDLKIDPFIFYDLAHLSVKHPLPGQEESVDLQGTGFGLRGTYGKYLEYETVLAWALRNHGEVEPGDTMLNFRLKARF